jgi:hypothetical protein
VEINFSSLKMRYNVAFDAYNQVARNNSERRLAGQQLGPNAFQSEANAKAAMEAARQALLEAIGLMAPLSGP